jgi:hypothetical protein
MTWAGEGGSGTLGDQQSHRSTIISLSWHKVDLALGILL